jgi:glycosyltransferase involved in cell wall biosynthesis
MLRRCLEKLRTSAEAVPGTEIIIVEQGTPAAKTICSEAGIIASIIADEGSGVSRGRNLGFRRARGDVVLFTDDDCEVPSDWVERHVQVLSDPDVVASFGSVSGLTRWGDQRYDATAIPSRHRAGSPPWQVGHSSNMAVRKTVLNSVGGFDERLGPGSVTRGGGEDADLILRLLRTGSILSSGTGDPVRHIEWRSSSEHGTTLLSYERGVGIWIGKAFREQPRAALSLLRWRRAQQRQYARNEVPSAENRVPTPALVGAFARGLITGFRMKPWVGIASEGEASSDSLSQGSKAAR